MNLFTIYKIFLEVEHVCYPVRGFHLLDFYFTEFEAILSLYPVYWCGSL